MNKINLTFLACLLLCISSYSQLSVSIDNKYGFKMPGSYSQTGYYGEIEDYGSAENIKSKKYSVGNGYQGSIHLGYAFKSGFGLNIGVGYLAGKKNHTKYTAVGASPYSSTGEYDIKSSFLRFFIGASHTGKTRLAPTIKMGLILATGNVQYTSKSMQTSVQYSYNPNPPYNTYTFTTTETRESVVKDYGGLSLGFYSALGIVYKVNQSVALALNLDVCIQDFSPKKGKLIKSTLNGVDQLPLLKVSQKEVEYEKDFTYSYSSQPNNSPGKSSKFSIPASSYGPSFSIIFTIGNRDSETKAGESTSN